MSDLLTCHSDLIIGKLSDSDLRLFDWRVSTHFNFAVQNLEILKDLNKNKSPFCLHFCFNVSFKALAHFNQKKQVKSGNLLKIWLFIYLFFINEGRAGTVTDRVL